MINKIYTIASFVENAANAFESDGLDITRYEGGSLTCDLDEGLLSFERTTRSDVVYEYEIKIPQHMLHEYDFGHLVLAFREMFGIRRVTLIDNQKRDTIIFERKMMHYV